MADNFYCRYYVGHKGKFGHEFMEFEPVIEEMKRIIRESEITKEDDSNWPAPDRVGRQELEIKFDKEHINFTASKIGSLLNVQESSDPE
eukprot:gene26221-32761_t